MHLMAGLCCPPNSLLVSIPSLTNPQSLLLSSSSTSVSVSSSPPFSCLPPIRCSKRKKKSAGKAKSVPPSRKQQSSELKLVNAVEEDVLLGWGAGATTLTALRPRLDDDDPSLQRRQQLQLHIAQQALLQSFRNSPDSLSRLGHEIDLGAKLKDSSDEGLEEDVVEEEEGEEEDFDFEWVEVNGEEGDGGDVEEEADVDEEGEEYVQYWEGDLGPMTEQEEAELLRQAAIELAQLEKKKRASMVAGSDAHLPVRDAKYSSEDEEHTGNTLEENEDWTIASTGVVGLKVTLEEDEDTSIASTRALGLKVTLDEEVEAGIASARAVGLKATSATEDQQVGAETLQPDDDKGDKETCVTDEEDEDTFIARITKEIKMEERGGGNNEDTSKTKRALPSVMRCFDRAKIFVKAGNGGNGVVAFRREKFVPFGGPSGGSGGRGGNIYVESDTSVNSLLTFRKGVHFRAGRGNHGQGKSQDGATGMDCTVKIPVGTIIREADSDFPGSGKVLLELTRAGQRELLLPGGRGGRGNTAFKTGRNKTPQLAEYGEEGAEMWLDLELKLVADVGIIGVPNAGKSTLLSVISAAQPAIGAYPFTTLLPNLGVVPIGFEATMVFADLPGLLEGAHLGIGLGHEFLRHTERCRVLVHIVDGTSQQPEQEYEAVRLELELFNPALSEKPYIVAFNKMDIPEAAQRWEAFQCFLTKKGIEPLCMSAATKMGTKEVVNRAYTMLQSLPSPAEDVNDTVENIEVGEVVKKERSAPIEQFEIYGDANSRTWEVCGAGLERFTQMTNWEYFEALKRFQHVLSVSGVNRALRERGVSEGDTVTVGEMEFVWHDSEDISTDWRRGFRGSRLWPH